MFARRSFSRSLVIGAAGLAMLIGLGVQPAAATEDQPTDQPSLINLASEKTSGTDWEREDSIITVKDTDGSGHAYVKVTGEALDGTRIIVAENTRAVIVLGEVNLNLGLSKLLGPHAAIALSSGVELDLQLEEGTVSTLVGARSNGTGGPGIFVPDGSTLNIEGLGDGSGQINVQGYVASAGIGVSRAQDSGTINIEGGNVYVVGGDSAAGIGVHQGHQGPINISGGTVHAIGGNGTRGLWGGAGIGSGSGGYPGPIDITGGDVYAEGHDGAAGIGSGHAARGGVKIVIAGGSVDAVGNGAGAGIGTSTMLGRTAQSANLIVGTGLDTSITATAGEREGSNAIGLGENDGSLIDMFVAVGGGLVLNGQEVPKTLTLKVDEGSSGAVYVVLPKSFTNVKDGRLRIANGLDPEVKLAFESTPISQPLKFTAKNFATDPESFRADDLAERGAEIVFAPVLPETDTPEVETAPARAFLPATSDAMLIYLGAVLTVALIALFIGLVVAHRRTKVARQLLARS